MDQDYKELVQDVWVEGSSAIQGIRDKLKRCKTTLLRWKKAKFQQGENSIKKLTSRLESLERQANVWKSWRLKTRLSCSLSRNTLDGSRGQNNCGTEKGIVILPISMHELPNEGGTIGLVV
jgi:hypothetical protein